MKLSRREFAVLIGAAVSAIPTLGRAASQTIMLPPGTVDCHNHIMGLQNQYPYASTRVYTPPEATIGQLKALRAEIGTSRNVLVTPSVYGTDNRCMVDALAALTNSA